MILGIAIGIIVGAVSAGIVIRWNTLHMRTLAKMVHAPSTSNGGSILSNALSSISAVGRMERYRVSAPSTCTCMRE